MATTLVPLFGPIPGGMEMFVILLIAVLLFGANKIPKLARSTGQAMGEFQKGRQQVEQELEEMEESMDPEADVASENDSTVDLDDEQPDEEFELDDETESSS
ncbi:MAG: sec-independent protein translocase protein TatA [Natronomonas sp.]|jgi:sec-independent protein translocase protein TatA